MKKLLLLLILLMLIPVLTFGQRTYKLDSIVVADLTGTDTTVFVRFFSYGDWSIQFDYSNFDADDATLSLGNSNDGTAFDKLDDSRFPYTLDVTTNSYTDEAGVTRATLSVPDDAFSFIYIGIKLTLNSVTDGTLYYKYAKE